MSCTSRHGFRRRGLAWAAGLLLLGLLLPGCSTTDHGSEMPWAGTEPWEGTIPLPPSMLQQ